MSTITFSYRKPAETVNGESVTNNRVLYILDTLDYYSAVETSKIILSKINEDDLVNLVQGVEGYESRKKTASVVPATVDMAKQAVVDLLVSLDKTGTDKRKPIYAETDKVLTIGNNSYPLLEYIGTNTNLNGYYIRGQVVERVVLDEGTKTYKETRSMVTTNVKKAISRKLPHNNIYTFKVDNIVNEYTIQTVGG